MTSLLYGSGLRLRECLRLRIKDLDFSIQPISGQKRQRRQGSRDNAADNLAQPTQRAHRATVKQIHERDLREGFGRVQLPYALARNTPNSNREWSWQYVFPAASPKPRSTFQANLPPSRWRVGIAEGS